MTDPTTGPKDNNAASPDVVARTEFRKEAIWLPQFAVQHMNSGQVFIEGKTFTECLIEGPAILAVLNETSFEGCNMGVASDPRMLLYKPLGQKLAGVVGMSNCRFVNCRFVQVGFTGSDEMLEQMETMLVGARSQMSGDSTS